MTKVTYFEDFHCFEYHSPHGAPQRFHYYLYSPVYERFPFFPMFSTHVEHAGEQTAYSSDFLPSRLARRFRDL